MSLSVRPAIVRAENKELFELVTGYTLETLLKKGAPVRAHGYDTGTRYFVIVAELEAWAAENSRLTA